MTVTNLFAFLTYLLVVLFPKDDTYECFFVPLLSIHRHHHAIHPNVYPRFGFEFFGDCFKQC